MERQKPCPIKDPFTRRLNENPYETIIAREVFNWFEKSQMVAIVHINPIKGDAMFNAKVLFHKNGIQLKKYGNTIIEKALNGTNYEVLVPMNKNDANSTYYLFCTEHKKVAKLLAPLKKVPQMHLLCGIIDGKLLTKNEFTDYAKLPNIDIMRSQLVNVLNLAGNTIVQNLQSHQTNLVRILDAHVNHNQKSSNSEDDKKSETDK
jgi:large subunit ribosomal protein L10